MQKIKCFFGFHRWTDWQYETNRLKGLLREDWVQRGCAHCNKQQYDFKN
jgi:hypothetical protein